MENKIEIYKTSKGTEIGVKLENDTVWLDTRSIAELFGVNRPAIVKHVGNIYKTAELDDYTTCSILEQDKVMKLLAISILNQNKQ